MKGLIQERVDGSFIVEGLSAGCSQTPDYMLTVCRKLGPLLETIVYYDNIHK